jgi:pyruvate,water dikinase
VARARAQAQRDEQLEQVLAACHDTAAVAELRHQLAYARRQEAVVEEHNHYLDQLAHGQLRQAVMAAARWLAAHGALASPDEVFWLHLREIVAALRAGAPPSFAACIAARRAQHAAWEKLTPPPLLGVPNARLPMRPPLRDKVRTTAAAGEKRLVGLGASPGRCRGRARVVPSSVAWPDLLPGEILVAENMGPRWTPLIPVLGALVLDGGALGQHHSVIAREYGVPAVLGTGNATQRIPDGAWVTVDGTAGTVDIEAS